VAPAFRFWQSATDAPRAGIGTLLFNLEHDTRNAIIGYLVPDGFADRPRIIVRDGQETLFEMECNEMREAVLRAGRHETGMIGFRIDDTILPDIEQRPELTLWDHKSGVLIYRRAPPASIVQKKLVRVETQMIPFLAMDKAIKPHFQYGADGVDRFGLETVQQMFHLNAVPSIYLAGRLQIRTFTEFLDRDFQAIAVINDPYMEMAERLFLLQRFKSVPQGIFGDRDRMTFGPAVEHFAEVDISSSASLKDALKVMPDPVSRILNAPLTRQIALSSGDESLGHNAVPAAVDMLSRFAVVGLREAPETYIEPIAELIGVEPSTLPEASNFSQIASIADRLRDLPIAEKLLEKDIIVYHFARQAILDSYKRTADL
jgi:hypothetical protein